MIVIVKKDKNRLDISHYLSSYDVLKLSFRFSKSSIGILKLDTIPDFFIDMEKIPEMIKTLQGAY